MFLRVQRIGCGRSGATDGGVQPAPPCHATRRVVFTGLLACLVPSVSIAQAPSLGPVRRAGDSLVLEWSATGPDRAYTIQVRDTLSGGLWLMPPSSPPWPLSTTSWSDTVGAGNSARFYRVLSVARAERGRVLSAARFRALTTFEIGFWLGFAGVSITPQYPVDLHKIVYETIDPWGGRIQASGLVAAPVSPGRALPLASFQHGTLLPTNVVPSTDFEQQIPGIGLATSGYLAVLPDLLGLGDSPGFHPYHHARSEATAAIDLLRATRTWAATNGVSLNGQVFLLGYSQGGHATLALHREIERHHAAEFTLTASAPMAGAYDLSGVMVEDFLSGRPQPNPYYFAYLLAAYQDVYRFTNRLADWLAAPYDTTLPPLLSNRVAASEINRVMPPDVVRVLKPEVLEAVRTDLRHPLRLALQDNDLTQWVPRAPLRLYHCLGDQDVPFANSQSALASFNALGATHVALVDPLPATNHSGCVLPAFDRVKVWFDSLKQ